MNDIASELAKLHELTGAEFSRQVEFIANMNVFHSLTDNPDIFTVGDMKGDDYERLLAAARKGVEHGYRVFILPNPKQFRTADFIFEQNGIYKIYDLKTIYGKSIVSTRLQESIGQTRHVLLNMTIDYNHRQLAVEILSFFRTNPSACEVLIFKHQKMISVTRRSVEHKDFVRTFMRSYLK